MSSRIEIPQAAEIFVVALDIDVGSLQAGSAQDHAHALRHLELGQHLLHALAVGRIGYLAADAAAAAGVGHQHAVAAGQRQEGGEGRALVAALLLDDLDEQDLAALDDFLNLVLADRLAAAALAGVRLFAGIVAADHFDRGRGRDAVDRYRCSLRPFGLRLGRNLDRPFRSDDYFTDRVDDRDWAGLVARFCRYSFASRLLGAGVADRYCRSGFVGRFDGGFDV